MKIKLLDGSWDVEVFLDRSEPAYDDNVFLSIAEECPQEQKLIKGNQITLGITAADARELAQRLLEVAEADEVAAREEAFEGFIQSTAGRVRKRQSKSAAPFTPKQGQYLAFIHHYRSKFGRAPAESDIQRHFLVSAPTVNQMMQRLERLGLIARTPGQARSIQLLVPPQLIQQF
jgi:repressor LexA